MITIAQSLITLAICNKCAYEAGKSGKGTVAYTGLTIFSGMVLGFLFADLWGL